MIRTRTNLLLWYTADEPDGSSDDVNAAQSAYHLIHSTDGYHPVSLALNCADYDFSGYSAGADIIVSDVYMIGNDVQMSGKYHTACTPDFGCCGCDNCEGAYGDISKRLDSYRARLHTLGWDKTKSLWSVTQAFGGAECVPSK